MLRAAAVGLALVTLLTGCSGLYKKTRDEADLELVRTVGVDLGGDGGLTVTADTGLGAQGEPPSLYTASAATLGEAVESLRMKPECRDTFFAHTEHLLIGEEAAKAGLDGVLDFVIRSPELRLDTELFIVKGSGAGETMQTVGGERASASDELRFLKRYAARTGRSYTVECGEAAAELLLTGASLAPAVSLKASGDISEGGAGAAVDTAGLAVLRDARLAYFLTEEESRGAVILKDRFEGAMLSVPDEAGNEVTVRLLKAKTKLEPSYRDGKLERVLVRVSLTAGVVQTAGISSPGDRETREHIAGQTAAAEKAAVDAALRRAQETGIDFLGLGAALSRRDPVKFSETKPAWEAVFPTLPVVTEVTCAVVRTYELDSPLRFSRSGT
ncbi:MAG: hypothetical protein IK136_00430 [Oscillospiraceae bacterium]|nr:hypothetical protein [Oscillospiraceae bacterium]